jgi:hypothetical protein
MKFFVVLHVCRVQRHLVLGHEPVERIEVGAPPFMQDSLLLAWPDPEHNLYVVRC